MVSDKFRFMQKLGGELEERELEPGEFERAAAVVQRDYHRRQRAAAAELLGRPTAVEAIEEEPPRRFPEAEETTEDLEVVPPR